jgi:hydrogenase maturation protease
MSGRIAIIGCGNANRRDDGAGSEVLRRLRTGQPAAASPDLSLLDAGTDGMAVMFAARGCTTLIIVDACRSGSEPGAIFEVPGGELAQPPRASYTLHDFRWDHALFAGRKMFRDAFPSDVMVFLIEAADLAFGIGLSQPVAAAVTAVTGRIEAIIAARGAEGALVP